MKKINNILVLLVVCLLLTSCKNVDRKITEDEGFYLKNQKDVKSSIQNIVLEIYFETGFTNERIKIYSQDSLIFNKVLTTDSQDGIAGFLELKQKVSNVSIVSKSDSVFIENKNYKLITVSNGNSILSIIKYKKIPENLIYD